MNTETDYTGKEKEKYPYLGIAQYREDQRYVVLFIERATGVVVTAEKDAGHNQGYWSESWRETDFDMFEGTIKLSN